MPFNEALFWMGLTVAGAGLARVLQRHLKDWWWSALLIAVGVLGAIYSIYSHLHPDVKLPSPPAWLYFLLLTWCAIGYDIYDHARSRSLFEHKQLDLEIAKQQASETRRMLQGWKMAEQSVAEALKLLNSREAQFAEAWKQLAEQRRILSEREQVSSLENQIPDASKKHARP